MEWRKPTKLDLDHVRREVSKALSELKVDGYPLSASEEDEQDKVEQPLDSGKEGTGEMNEDEVELEDDGSGTGTNKELREGAELREGEHFLARRIDKKEYDEQIAGLNASFHESEVGEDECDKQ